MLLVVLLIEILTCTIILFGILFGFSRGLSNVTFEGHSGDVSDMTLLDVLEALDYRCERGIFVRKLCMGICHYPFGLGISCIIQKHIPSYVPFPSSPDCATPLPLSSLQQSPCKGQLQLC